MFQAGDIVVYGTTGVCEVAAVTSAPAGVAPGDYYLLRPLYQDGTIYSPVENRRIRIRPALTHAEADAFIDRMGAIPALPLPEEKPLQVAERYRQIFAQNDCETLAGLIIALYTKKQELLRRRRKFSQVDDRTIKRAQELLHGELAYALAITPDEVAGYIGSRIGTEGSPVATA